MDSNLESLSRLSIDLLNFLESGDYERLVDITNSFPEYYCRKEFDLIVRVGEGPDAEDFYCNSDVLRSRSRYLQNALLYVHESEGEYKVLEEPQISPRTFRTLLRFIYKSDVNASELEIDGTLCVDLLKAAEHFGLDDVTEELQKYILDDKSGWLHDNFVKIINGVFTSDGDERIRHRLIHRINSDPRHLLDSKDLADLDERCFSMLLDDECLYISPGTAWDILVRWGVQQSPILRQDISHWTLKEWTVLRDAVGEVITRIQFSRISRNDFYGKVIPFGKVIPQDLNHPVLQCYLDKDILYGHSEKLRHIILDYSSIINHFHADMILKWMGFGQEKLDPLKRSKSLKRFFHIKKGKKSKASSFSPTYQFDLLFRTTIEDADKFEIENYEKTCNNLANTLVIVKVLDSKAIIGGLAPNGLNRDFLTLYTPSVDQSFLFSFQTGEPKTESSIVSRARKVRSANDEYIPYLWVGPRFGARDMVIDLKKMKCTCYPQYYEQGIYDGKEFRISECEIFQINEF
ncbi:14163_t:CDS:2 [Acaulospora colombiana]|uniref:14163_t:CDS:1 n=1 Tax=Acaulospora colombiana TaxID=27376 RepID=A0ACA9LS10_9GLOM|nr:14163_t:CDS:2 [Acaulospora colombiana]